MAKHETDMIRARAFAIKFALKDSRGDIANLARAFLRLSGLGMPRCEHGHAVIDELGEQLMPSCGCRLKADIDSEVKRIHAAAEGKSENDGG